MSIFKKYHFCTIPRCNNNYLLTYHNKLNIINVTTFKLINCVWEYNA